MTIALGRMMGITSNLKKQGKWKLRFHCRKLAISFNLFTISTALRKWRTRWRTQGGLRITSSIFTTSHPPNPSMRLRILLKWCASSWLETWKSHSVKLWDCSWRSASILRNLWSRDRKRMNSSPLRSYTKTLLNHGPSSRSTSSLVPKTRSKYWKVFPKACSAKTPTLCIWL